jgi:(1->4)-alpha-D-glucan 1-alpha-D-glucosylmutase
VSGFRATCRLQMHAGFTLTHAREVVDYLERLGVSHLYLSPVLRAREGSTHGYDVADSSTLNPELGTEDEWRALSRDLRERGMGILLDIVPNHMGIGSENPYWNDVLTHGQAAHYANWFDIDWEPPQRATRGRVLVPVLGRELREVVERGELTLRWHGDRIELQYFEHTFPIDPASAPRILRLIVPEIGEEGEPAEAMQRAIDLFERMPIRAGLPPPRRVERYRCAEEGWTALATALDVHPGLRAALDRVLREFPAGDGGPVRMLSFLDAQPYRLGFWRRAASEINYRRFFDINELAALRMEDPVVFGERHRLLFGWIADDLIDGLRIDHVDGLCDPLGYLVRLRRAVDERRQGQPREFPLYVEKILSPGEHLPPQWPVAGTTGYEYMNDLESVFIHAEGARQVESAYRTTIRVRDPAHDFHEVAYRGKVAVLRSALRSDVARLAALLAPVARRDERTRNLSRPQLVSAIVEMIAALPVYRTYLTAEQPIPGEQDRRWVMQALERARGREVASDAAVTLIADAFLHHGDIADQQAREERMRFVMRFQQTSSPATAKGVEDTALYRYVPLASLNEVGGEPSRPLDSAVSVLHAANRERQERWPASMLSVSTHDTKRSADVRARIDVLSEIPGRWTRAVAEWRRLARGFRTRVGDGRRTAPDASTEYLLFQNLVGIWPPGSGESEPGEMPAQEVLDDLCERIDAYMLKAVREAKAQTSWTDPDEEWEAALSAYVRRVFEGGGDSTVLREVARLAGEIGQAGRWNALARQALQLMSPGVPDVYQGDELWNLSLVDPDNRRPVDWALRSRMLSELDAALATEGEQAGAALESEILRSVVSGRAKMYVTRVALAARAADPELFARGKCLPLHAEGVRAGNLVAFARALNGRFALIVVPRLTVALSGGKAPIGEDLWGDTRIQLPAELHVNCWSVCGRRGATLASGDLHALRVGHLMTSFPVALLISEAS